MTEDNITAEATARVARAIEIALNDVLNVYHKITTDSISPSNAATSINMAIERINKANQP